MSRTQAVKDFYENADIYLGQDYNIRIRTEVVQHFLRNKHFKNVLDMPCGNGYISLKNARYFSDLLLVDFSEKMIQEVTKIKSSLNVAQAHVQCSDILQTNFQKDQFDLVISIGILAHISNPSQLLDYLFNLVQPGGFLILQNTSSTHFYGRIIHSYLKVKQMLGKMTYTLNKVSDKLIEEKIQQHHAVKVSDYKYNQSFLGFSKLFSNEKKYTLTKSIFGNPAHNKNRWFGSDTIYLIQKNER